VKVPIYAQLIDGKWLISDRVSKTSTIGAICYQIATNFSNYQPSGADGLAVRDQPSFPLVRTGIEELLLFPAN